MISIQEMTKQTGVTVRTLRYYDQIGLLKPYAKSSGGHRLYSEEEAKKLQQIQFLKMIGFRLQEIKEILTNPKWDWQTSLENQMSYVLNEQKKLKKMESAIRGLIHTFAMGGEVNLPLIEELIQLSGRKVEKERFREQLLDKNERNLLQRLPNVNQGDPDSLEWVALIGQLKQHMPKGPESLPVQRIIRRMMEKTEEAFGDMPDFIDKLWKIRKSPTQSRKIGLYPLEPEFLEFIALASDAYEREEKTSLAFGKNKRR